MVIPTCTFDCKYYHLYCLFTYFIMFIIWSNFSEDMVMVCSAFAASLPTPPLDCFLLFFGVSSFASSSDELSEETDFLHFFSFLSLLFVLVFDVFLHTTVSFSVSDSKLLEPLSDEEKEDESLEMSCLLDF